MAAAPSDFFKTERTASEIKAELLACFFEVWGTAMLPQANAADMPLRCIDLLACLDGDEPNSAVLQLLRQVYKSSGSRTDLNKGVSTVFYDADTHALAGLQEKAEQLPFYQDLVHPPALLQETGEEDLAELILNEEKPAFVFFNPTQEGVSQQVLQRAVEAGAPDLLMLFSPKALETALKKAKANSPLQQLFGERLEEIRAFNKQNRNPDRREEYLLNSFEEIFRSKDFYTLRFQLNLPDKKETGYYLVLACSSDQAYTRLKELLERYSDYQEDGVPLFGANLQAQQTALFHEHYRYAVAKLAQELLADSANCNNRSLQYVYERHNVGTHYTLTNYFAAYERLMRQGLVRFINPKTGQPVTKLTATSLIRYSLKKETNQQ